MNNKYIKWYYLPFVLKITSLRNYMEGPDDLFYCHFELSLKQNKYSSVASSGPGGG